uniref:LysR family transcriptional regulator n=1 Tax=Marinobacterium profundum TaxID=1714300 RepID=UPI0008312344|nr:LysR family transcriptional regulator [Marinobacterium profundum]
MDKFLHHFHMVATYKNLTAASDALHISQPALSKSIKKLEDYFDVKLFERQHRGMELTAYGKALLHRVERMDMEFRYARDEISSLKTGTCKMLRIGAGAIWGLSYMPDIMNRLYQAFPGIELVLQSGAIQELLPKLLNGELDIALGGPESGGSVPDELVHIPLVTVDFVVIARPSHPLASVGCADARALNSYRWVVFQQAQENILQLNGYFARNQQPAASICLQSSFWSSALSLLHLDDYLMGIPRQLYWMAEKEGLVIVPMNESIWQFSTGIWYHPSAASLPAIAKTIDFIRAASKA